MAMPEQKQHVFKLVKRRLSALQRILKTDLEEGRMPLAIDVAEFVETSAEMDDLCEPEWRTAMDAYMELLESFKSAVSGENTEKARQRFQDLLTSKISCHKQFR